MITIHRGSGSWNTVIKPSDESTNTDTVLGDDAALLIPLAANTNYIVKGSIFVTTGATGDFKWAMNGPASPTRIIYGGTTAAAGGPDLAAQTSYDSPLAITQTSTDLIVELSAIIENGSNTGNLIFRWAQNTSNGTNTTVRKGSYMQWRTF